MVGMQRTRSVRIAAGSVVRFGHFEVDLSTDQLRKHGVRLRLFCQSFEVLRVLLEHAGEIVIREDLRRRLWPENVFVDFENNLNTAVARLREALGDSAEHPRFIETLPRRGYRFIGNVFARPSAAAQQAPLQRARLVVLPFVNLTGDPAQEYFSDAITDEIITELASLAPEQLAVIARTTAMHYKDSHKEVSRIGRELGVDYVVEGSVRHTEDGITANVQLIQTSDQTHLFARRYDAALRDIFNMQHSISQTIVAHIPAVADRARVEVIGVARGARKRTENLAAYNEYIQGRHDMWKLGNAMTTAKQHLERAIALDPEFALGHDALAEFYWYLGYVGLVSPREAFSAGIAHARRAIEIDDGLAETHALLGQFHKTVDYNWPEVHREMTLALRLDPNSPLVRMRHAVSWLMPQGRPEEAAAELEFALEFDPLAFEVRYWLGIMLLLSGRYERAIDECQKILDLDPDYLLAHFVIATCYRYRKMFDEALAAQHRALELSGGSVMMLGWLGMALAESGETAQACDVLHRLHGMAAQGYVPPSSFAWVHLGLKEIDTAFEWLNRAVEEYDQLMMPIKTYGFLAPIRADPRYFALLRRMNLKP
jgi:TolB-like protein/Tfp pilus assembly protein PilF